MLQDRNGQHGSVEKERDWSVDNNNVDTLKYRIILYFSLILFTPLIFFCIICYFLSTNSAQNPKILLYFISKNN